MFARIWTVNISKGKIAALETFARQISLPVFREQPGCLGVLFTKSVDICTTITLWEDMDSIEILKDSASYQTVVSQIEESGIVCGEHRTEVFECYGGFTTNKLAASLTSI